MSKFSEIEQMIVNEVYKDILPYVLANYHFIVLEEFSIMDRIIPAAKGQNAYYLKSKNFTKDLIGILDEIYAK